MLKNFSDINMSIEIKKGNLLRTVSVQKNILAQAELEDEFPKDFAEYNEENQMNLDVTMHGLVAQEVKEAVDKSGVERFGGWKEDEDGCR